MATLEEYFALMQQAPPMDPRQVAGTMTPQWKREQMAQHIQQLATLRGADPAQPDPMQFAQEQAPQMSPNAPGESFADRLGVGLASSLQGMPQPRGFGANLLAGGMRGFSSNQVQDMERRAGEQKRLRDAAILMNKQRAQQGRDAQDARIKRFQTLSDKQSKAKQREADKADRKAAATLLHERGQADIRLRNDLQAIKDRAKEERKVARESKFSPTSKTALDNAFKTVDDARQKSRITARALENAQLLGTVTPQLEQAAAVSAKQLSDAEQIVNQTQSGAITQYVRSGADIAIKSARLEEMERLYPQHAATINQLANEALSGDTGRNPAGNSGANGFPFNPATGLAR